MSSAVDTLLRLGTSGWSYKDWLGNFYPQFCPQADFLKYYTTRFDTVSRGLLYWCVRGFPFISHRFKRAG